MLQIYKQDCMHNSHVPLDSSQSLQLCTHPLNQPKRYGLPDLCGKKRKIEKERNECGQRVGWHSCTGRYSWIDQDDKPTMLRGGGVRGKAVEWSHVPVDYKMGFRQVFHPASNLPCHGQPFLQNGFFNVDIVRVCVCR